MQEWEKRDYSHREDVFVGMGQIAFHTVSAEKVVQMHCVMRFWHSSQNFDFLFLRYPVPIPVVA